MTVYLDLLVLLNFGVDLLLILGANRLCGYPNQICRSVMAALIGGLYAGVCVLPGFHFLGNAFWRIVSLSLMGILAFGFCGSAVKRTAVFVLLSLALGGAAMGVDGKNLPLILVGATGVFFLCNFGIQHGQRFVEIAICYGGKRIKLTAMRDTGNTLKDPITGESVLVVGADVANALLGLTQQQLLSPITTMEQLHYTGMRLIPYRAVGQPNGMLLAMKMDEVTAGKERIGKLVAFAPQCIGSKSYQALIGGAI